MVLRSTWKIYAQKFKILSTLIRNFRILYEMTCKYFLQLQVESDLDAVTYSIYDRLNGVLTLYPIALLILLFFKDPLMMTYFRKNFPPMRELSKVNPSLAVTVASNVYVKNTSTPQFVIAENTNARFHQLKALFEANAKYGQ